MIRYGFGITNPLSALARVRKPKVGNIDKRTPYGRHIYTGEDKWRAIDGRVYGKSFHATKGWRRRRVYKASVRQRLIGI